MEIGSVTDVGLKRKTNQDKVYASKDSKVPLFLVADGMGGHRAGEIASEMAMNILINKFYSESLDEDIDVKKLMKSSIEEANTKIYLKSSRYEEYKGMGTTITAAYVYLDKIHIGHVGDSRAYLIRENSIKQVTEDHSYVNQLLKLGTITEDEAKNHPNKNMITRAVGSSSILEVDSIELYYKKDDILVLASDGLTNMLSDEEILNQFKADYDIQRICENLVEKANYNGGKDNISIVAIKFDEEVKA